MPIKLPEIDAASYYTVKEFAELFGRSRSWAWSLLRRGKVTSVRVQGAGQHYIKGDQALGLLVPDTPAGPRDLDPDTLTPGRPE